MRAYVGIRNVFITLYPLMKLSLVIYSNSFQSNFDRSIITAFTNHACADSRHGFKLFQQMLWFDNEHNAMHHHGVPMRKLVSTEYAIPFIIRLQVARGGNVTSWKWYKSLGVFPIVAILKASTKRRLWRGHGRALCPFGCFPHVPFWTVLKDKRSLGSEIMYVEETNDLLLVKYIQLSTT